MSTRSSEPAGSWEASAERRFGAPRHSTARMGRPDADPPVLRALAHDRHRGQMSAVGLLVAGGSGDDLREQGSHDAPRGLNGGGPVRDFFWPSARGDPRNVLLELGLQEYSEGRPVIIVCGGADGLRGAALTRAIEMLGPALSAAAKRTDAVVVDGGSASGVMEIASLAGAQRPDSIAVLVGVAPRGKVTYPGGPAGDGAPLKQNHSLALADSAEWGGETRLLIALADALASGHRQVPVALAGGASGEGGDTWSRFVAAGRFSSWRRLAA